MKLLICPETDEIRQLYKNHSTYHPGDSGLDLFVPEQIVITSGDTVFIDLQIRCEMIDDQGKNVSYYLYPRSSLSKTQLRFANSVGIMDEGYRGKVKIALDNIKSEDYLVEKYIRLVQLCAPNLKPFTIEIVDKLSTSSRGEGGFGSTGTTLVEQDPIIESTDVGGLDKEPEPES